jgi:hypothetical protein
VGWPVPAESITCAEDHEWQKQAAAQEYGDDTAWYSAWILAEQAQLGDPVWFRNTERRFYLAELLGPRGYEYQDAAAIGADIANYRRMRIIEAGRGRRRSRGIIACFRPSSSFPAIRPSRMLAFRPAGRLNRRPRRSLDLCECMSNANVENVGFVYLQFLGRHVLPGTRSATAAHYEFALVNCEL